MAAPEEKSPCSGRRVLVVDDARSDRGILARWLKEEGYQVKTAADGLEALDLWEQWRPTLILMDVVMSPLGGFEAVRRLRSGPHGHQALILMCSIKNTRADRLWAREQGANAYLAKPLERARCMGLVASLIEKAHQKILNKEKKKRESMVVDRSTSSDRSTYKATESKKDIKSDFQRATKS